MPAAGRPRKGVHMSSVNVGIIGFGTVGAGTYETWMWILTGAFQWIGGC
jgi:hypothetical protein